MNVAAPSSKRIEANRRNAQKSTGPKTPEGKSRVRLNALKHGLTASTAVLPGEDPEALQSRVDAWADDLGPRTAMEAYLVERAAHFSWQLDRADRTIAARLTDQMRHHASDRASGEADEVAELARRLFWDPRGPIALYPHEPQFLTVTRISWPDRVEDPLNPARIVNRLESLEVGCRWLLDRWGELKTLLDDGRRWQAPDRLRAVRLLGHQPLDAADDDQVMSIYLATNAMDPDGPNTMNDVFRELGPTEVQPFVDRLNGRDVNTRQPAEPATGKAVLLAIVDHAVARLEALLEIHRQRNASERPDRLDHLAFDDSDDGERLRRYQLAHGRILLRTINTLFKVRKESNEGGVATSDLPSSGLPAVYEPPIISSDELATIAPEFGLDPADASGPPADADALSPAAPAPHLHAEDPSDHPVRPERDRRTDVGADAIEISIRPHSDLTQNSETKPTPAQECPTPPLDPCSEGRHIEPAIVAEPPVPTAGRPWNPAAPRAGRDIPSNAIPPAMIRLLAEMVRRQAMTGGPPPPPGPGRSAARESP
jgi:hypothetical protein